MTDPHLPVAVHHPQRHGTPPGTFTAIVIAIAIAIVAIMVTERAMHAKTPNPSWEITTDPFSA